MSHCAWLCFNKTLLMCMAMYISYHFHLSQKSLLLLFFFPKHFKNVNPFLAHGPNKHRHGARFGRRQCPNPNGISLTARFGSKARTAVTMTCRSEAPSTGAQDSDPVVLNPEEGHETWPRVTNASFTQRLQEWVGNNPTSHVVYSIKLSVLLCKVEVDCNTACLFGK